MLIMYSRVWQARREARQNNCRNPASEAELAGYVWFRFRDTQTGAAQCSSLQQAPRQGAHENSTNPTYQPHNFASEAELAGYAWFLFRNTQTGAAQCSSCAHAYGKPDENHDKTTAAILRQKQNWLGMCGFSSETAHENSTEPTKSRTTLHQKQNWLVMCGFSSETLRLERHSAHHCSSHHAKDHMKTALNRHVNRTTLHRTRIGWLCVVSFQKHSDWSVTGLIVAGLDFSATQQLPGGHAADTTLRQKQNWLFLSGFSYSAVSQCSRTTPSS